VIAQWIINSELLKGFSAIKELPQLLKSLSNWHEGNKKKQKMSEIRLLE